MKRIRNKKKKAIKRRHLNSNYFQCEPSRKARKQHLFGIYAAKRSSYLCEKQLFFMQSSLTTLLLSCQSWRCKQWNAFQYFLQLPPLATSPVGSWYTKKDLSQGWILANQCDVMKSYTHTHKTKQKQQAFNIKSAFASAPDHQSMIC